MGFEVSELVRTIQKPFDMNSNYFDDGDEVLIVTDTAMEESVQSALFAAAVSHNLDPTMSVMMPRRADNADPTEAIGDSIIGSDFCIFAASKALAHSGPSAKALDRDARIIFMQGITPEILRSGAANADYETMQRVANKMDEIYSDGKEIKVTSSKGTDVVADIEDRFYWPIAGQFSEEMNSVTFPDGEVGVAPHEESTHGVVVWDESLHGIGQLTDPIELTVEDGWVTEVNGGKDADRFRRLMEEEGDANAWYCAAEIAVGINAGAEFTGSLRTDKKVEGSVHIAVGDNIDLGGSIESAIHLDGVIAEPSVWVDDRQIVDGGNLLIDA